MQHAESAKNRMKTMGNHGKVRVSQTPNRFAVMRRTLVATILDESKGKL